MLELYSLSLGDDALVIQKSPLLQQDHKIVGEGFSR